MPRSSGIGSLAHQQPARRFRVVEPVQRGNDADPGEVQPEVFGRVVLERVRFVDQHRAVVGQQRTGGAVAAGGQTHPEVGEKSA